MPTLKTTVEINGFVVRALRARDGLSMQEVADRVAEALGRQPGDENTYTYVRKIETGHTRRVSPKVFNALLAAFSIEDRRVLLANPHGIADALEATA